MLFNKKNCWILSVANIIWSKVFIIDIDKFKAVVSAPFDFLFHSRLWENFRTSKVQILNRKTTKTLHQQRCLLNNDLTLIQIIFIIYKLLQVVCWIVRSTKLFNIWDYLSFWLMSCVWIYIQFCSYLIVGSTFVHISIIFVIIKILRNSS